MLIPFDPAVFRAMFPEFKDTTCTPDASLQMWFSLASIYISRQDCACYMLAGDQRAAALNMMTAHMGKLFKLSADGDTAQVMVSATIDRVSVTVKPPPAADQFSWWLSTTPYGQMLLALLDGLVAGGLYIGGLPERDAFRRVGGGFGGLPPWAGC